MTIVVKHFDKLTAREVREIYRLRNRVFIVEQNCAYLDIDDYDTEGYHVMAMDQDGLQAYARVLPAGTVYDQVSIGRVISLKRRCGLGTQVVQAAMRVAVERFNARTILIGAQTYAVPFYQASGFTPYGDTYTEDGIPHIHMKWEADHGGEI